MPADVTVKPRVAIVGAGPSGFYACEQLLGAGFDVDLYDRLPTPFGLVRFGVAPDHPKIKSVTRVYEKTAAKDGFRFFGGVEVGSDVSREDLLQRYHAVIYAVGTAMDNRLGVPGEDLPGSVPATDFVAWYNGHPAFADHEFDLSCSRAVVIGNGNVAIDVARMLVLDEQELQPTDTADHALERFGQAAVREVVLVGRRGPAQAAFTNPELRELGALSRAAVAVDPSELELDEDSERWLDSSAAPATVRTNVEILRDYASRDADGATHRIEMRFLRSPVEIVAGPDGRVAAVRFVRNRLEPDSSGRLQAVPTGEEELLPCGLVVRSIGYRGNALPGVPFDERRGLIPNERGRVVAADGAVQAGEYVVGWIKRGPSGVIGTNKRDASETVTSLLEDAHAGLRDVPEGAGSAEIASWLQAQVRSLVTWEGWQAIDRHEQAAGEPHGRPRVKLVRIPEMIGIASRP